MGDKEEPESTASAWFENKAVHCRNFDLHWFCLFDSEWLPPLIRPSLLHLDKHEFQKPLQDVFINSVTNTFRSV